MQLSGARLAAGSVPELPGIDAYQEWLGVPLISPEGVIGALVMASRVGGMAYTERDRELLQFVSTQIATTIQRKQAESRLQHIASHDPLTDLPNRLLFQDRFEMALKRARREGEKVALLYLDLDEFKMVNDSFGHQVGDLMLSEVARRLSGCVRESDTVAPRMGGDEFAVLIPNIQGADSVYVVMDKIRTATKDPCELGECTLKASISIGVALYPDHGESLQELFKYADDHMYHAKRSRAN